VLYALQGSGYHVSGSVGSTIDMKEMVDIGWWISQKLGRAPVSRVGRAIGTSKSEPKKFNL
jgi:hydroxymethylglutaryl-CoA lyase